MAESWQWRYPRVAYANGSRKSIGYLWSPFPLVFQLELADRARGSAMAPAIHFMAYPNNALLQGQGPPRCLHESGYPWGWVQVLEVGGFNQSGWWYVNCYDAEELVRWLKGADMPGRTYEFRSQAVA